MFLAGGGVEGHADDPNREAAKTEQGEFAPCRCQREGLSGERKRHDPDWNSDKPVLKPGPPASIVAHGYPQPTGLSPHLVCYSSVGIVQQGGACGGGRDAGSRGPSFYDSPSEAWVSVHTGAWAFVNVPAPTWDGRGSNVPAAWECCSSTTRICSNLTAGFFTLLEV